MKKHFFIAVVLFVLFAADVIAQEHARNKVKYYHQYDWGERERTAQAIYIDNLCYFDNSYNESVEYVLLIRIKGSSIDDGLYANVKYPSFPRMVSRTGAWDVPNSDTEGLPYYTAIATEEKSNMVESGSYEIYSNMQDVYVDLATLFKNCYIKSESMDEFRSDDKNGIARLSEFCKIVNAFNKEQLRILRNTIYAVHGYKFNSDDLNKIFNKCYWYKVNPDFDEDLFSYKEKVYLTLIKQAEQIVK